MANDEDNCQKILNKTTIIFDENAVEFPVWKAKVEQLFTELRIHYLLVDDYNNQWTDLKKNNAMSAYGFFLSNTRKTTQALMMKPDHKNRPKVCWQTIMGKWEQRTDADKAMKLNEWYTLVLKRGETATELIERASLIATELAMLQHNIPDKQRLDHLNQILYAHKEYETVCTSVMIQGGFTLPQFTNAIRTIDRIKQNVKQRNDSTGTENSALETRQRPSFEERQHTAMD